MTIQYNPEPYIYQITYLMQEDQITNVQFHWKAKSVTGTKPSLTKKIKVEKRNKFSKGD